MDELLELKQKKLYAKLFDLLPIIKTIPQKEWGILHMLAYIMVKYQEKFNMEFKISYDGPPSKSHEYKLISRLKMILPKDELKDYIDWFYDNYTSTRRFTSVGAIIKVESVVKYDDYKANKNKITMYTKLPEDVISIAKNYKDLDYISTYGDLYFIYKSDESLIAPLLQYIDINKLKGLDG